ncbi:MAG: lanthionine synthetase LanC family protein [Acidimicrobiales bacterium]
MAGRPPASETALYVGTSGRGYALAVVGGLLDDPSITDRGVDLLSALPDPDDAAARPLDVLFGLPGIAAALGAVATMTADESLGALATRYARACEREWREASSGDRQRRIEAFRIGVAHGITGMQLCMSRVFEATEDPLLLSWIHEMVETENERVDRRDGVPARLEAVDRRPDLGWCWGAAGYVMAREVVAEVTGLDQALHAVEKGRRLAAGGRGRIDRLCCGKAGQAAVLGSESEHLTDLLSRPLAWRFEKDSPHQNASLLRGVALVARGRRRGPHPAGCRRSWPRPPTDDPRARDAR